MVEYSYIELIEAKSSRSAIALSLMEKYTNFYDLCEFWEKFEIAQIIFGLTGVGVIIMGVFNPEYHHVRSETVTLGFLSLLASFAFWNSHRSARSKLYDLEMEIMNKGLSITVEKDMGVVMQKPTLLRLRLTSKEPIK